MNIKNYDTVISKELGCGKLMTRKIITLLELKMHEGLMHGEDIAIHNVGRFYTHVKKKHNKWNPIAKEMQEKPKAHKLKFVISKILNKKIMAKPVYDADYFASEHES